MARSDSREHPALIHHTGSFPFLARLLASVSLCSPTVKLCPAPCAVFLHAWLCVHAAPTFFLLPSASSSFVPHLSRELMVLQDATQAPPTPEAHPDSPRHTQVVLSPHSYGISWAPPFNQKCYQHQVQNVEPNSANTCFASMYLFPLSQNVSSSWISCPIVKR